MTHFQKEYLYKLMDLNFDNNNEVDDNDMESFTSEEIREINDNSLAKINNDAYWSRRTRDARSWAFYCAICNIILEIYIYFNSMSDLQF